MKSHWLFLSVRGATRQYQPTIAGLMPAIPFIIFSFFFNSASEDPRQISEPVQQDLAIVIDLLKEGGEKKEKKCFLAYVNNKTIMEIRLVMQPTLRLAETPCGTYNTHQEGWSTVSHQLWWQFWTTSEIEVVDCPLSVPPIFGGFYFQQSIQNECLFKLCHWFNFQQTAVRFVKSLSFNNLPVNQPNNSLVLCVFVNWHLHLICEVYPLAPFLPHSMLSVTSVTLGPSDRKLFNIDVWLGVFH